MSRAHFETAVAMHRKVLLAGNGGAGLWFRLTCWCREQLTDGLVPRAVLKTFATDDEEIRRAVDAGLLDEESNGDVRIHDYLDHNHTRKTVEKIRKEKAKAGQKGARSKWAPRDGKLDGGAAGKRDGTLPSGSPEKGDGPRIPDPQDPRIPDPQDPREEIERGGAAPSAPTVTTPEVQVETKPRSRQPAKTKPTETSLPEDWTPTPSFWAWVERKRYARSDVDRCVEAMTFWARSNGARKADWNATLQGWVSREASDGKVAIVEAPRPSRGLRDVPTAEELANVDHAAVAANIRAARERLRAHLVTPPDESPTLFADPATEVAQ